jgi:hypothetical protein
LAGHVSSVETPSLRIFYAFPALQIEHIVSDDTLPIVNPLQISSPHELYIEHSGRVMPLGEEVRFRRLEGTTKIPDNLFLTPWSKKIGVMALYRIENDVFILIDLPTLLNQARTDT